MNFQLLVIDILTRKLSISEVLVLAVAEFPVKMY
jgi:hypothetical protein